MAELFILLSAIAMIILTFRIARNRRYRPGKAKFKGRVSHLNMSTESIRSFSKTKNLLVWRFVVECYDQKGNKTTSVPIEMRAQSISGFVENGNEIEIFDTPAKNQILKPRKLFNRTLSSYITVRKSK